jgi:hypothetical protein
MPRNKIAIFDRFGNATQSNGGVPIFGPAIGARNISYVPEGGIVSAVGTASFELPLQFAENNAITKDTQIMIYQEDIYDGPVFWGRVITRPRTLAADGTYVSVQCQDVLYELASVTVTSGFVSRPLEVANAMLTRLLARQTETTWLFRNTLITSTSPTNFTAFGIEVLRAIGKYASENFASFKRETSIDPVTGKPRRQIVIGQFSGISSGIQIINAPRDLNSIAQERWPAEKRYVKSATFEDDAVNYNRLIPTAGQDTAAASITLYPLYGLTNFVGYNAKYPIKARIREDIMIPTPLPGQSYPITPQYYEFYIEDINSIAVHRVSELQYPRTDITPLSNTPNDIFVAATTLYKEAVTYLIDHITAHLSLDITTEHRGDVRNIGGKTVYVRCHAKNKAGDFVMDIEGDYRVQKVEIVNADSEGSCRWTLSTDGRSTETNDVLFMGAIEDIDYLKKVPTLLLGFPIYPIDDFIDNANAIHKTFVNSNAFISTGQVILDLRLENVRSAIRPLSHAHTFAIDSHAHTITIADHSHSIGIEGHAHGFSTPDHSHPLNLSDHAHGMSVAGHAHGASNGDHGHGFNFGSHSHAIISTNPWIDLTGAGAVAKANVGKNGESVVTGIGGTTGTGGHTHGMGAVTITAAASVSAGGSFSIGTTGAGGISQSTGTGGAFNGTTSTGGAVSTNTGTAGGYSGNTGTAGAFSGSTGGAGGLSSATGINAGAEWGLILGPKPAIIDVWINTVYIGRYTADTKVDITQVWHTTQDNTMDIASYGTTDGTNPTGLGRITGAVTARMIGSTLANQTL